MISLSCGISFGPKMFSGGISNVTRQYDGKRRSSRVCCVADVPSERFMVWTPDLILGRGDAWPRAAAPAFWRPSSADLRHIAGFQKAGSGSSLIEIMRHGADAASDGLRLSAFDPAAYFCRWDRGVAASMMAFLGAVSGKVIKIGRTQTPTTAIMAPGTSIQPVRCVRTWAT